MPGIAENCSMLAETNFRFAVASFMNVHNHVQHTNQMSAVDSGMLNQKPRRRSLLSEALFLL